MLLSFCVVFVVLFFTGYSVRVLGMLCLPLIMLVEYILALGIVMIVSAVTVYLRDLEYLLSIITMAWQFLTPVMYSIDMVPKKVRWVFGFNPMTSIINAYRDILYYDRVPKMQTLFSAMGLGILLFLIGWFVFDKLQRKFVEEL